MNGKYILDTNVIIGLFNGNIKIREKISNADEVFIPSIAIGELIYGAMCSKNRKKNIEKIQAFILSNTILSCDSLTSFEYAKIKYQLRQKGKPIPENDIWIAAISRQYNITLATQDDHFDEIEMLLKEKW